MKAGMRRIVSLVKGYAVLSCGHLTPCLSGTNLHVAWGERAFLLCPTCPRPATEKQQ